MAKVICGQEAIDHVAANGGVLRRGEYGGGGNSCGRILSADEACSLALNVGAHAVYCEEHEPTDDDAIAAMIGRMATRDTDWAWLQDLRIAVAQYLREPSDGALVALREMARGRDAAGKLNPAAHGVTNLRNATSTERALERHNGYELSQHRAARHVVAAVEAIFAGQA